MDYEKFTKAQILEAIHKLEKLEKQMLAEIIEHQGEELQINSKVNIKVLANIFQQKKKLITELRENLKLYDDMQKRKQCQHRHGTKPSTSFWEE